MLLTLHGEGSELGSHNNFNQKVTMFRERFWDETVEQYEANQEHHNLIEMQKIADRIFDIGWVCGVPEDVLCEVYNTSV